MCAQDLICAHIGFTVEQTEPTDATERTEALDATERAADQLLPPLQVRKVLGIAATTLREWDASGVLKAVQRTRGGHRRYRESDVISLLAELKAVA